MSTMVHIWLSHVVHAFWQTTLATAAVIAISRLLPIRNPRIRHGVLMIGLLKFAIPPMLPLATGIFSAAPPVAEWSLVDRVLAFAYGWQSLIALVMAVHITGVCVALARLVMQCVRLRALRHSGAVMHRGRVPILISTEIVTPLTLGIFRPAIILPARLVERLSAGALDDIIAHELEHVRRHDVALNTLHAVVGAIWWFDPVYWFLERRVRAAREECCDDAVIAEGATSIARYAETLAEAAAFASNRSPMMLAQIAESPHSLVSRIERLADPHFAPRRRMGFAGFALVAVLTATLLPGLRLARENRFAFDHATRHALHVHHH